MKKGVSPQIGPFFSVNEIGPIQLDPCSLNICQQYACSNSPFEIPRFYSGDEAIRYMVPNSSDNRFLILYPNSGNIRLNGTSERRVESGTQTTQVQTDAQVTDLSASPEAPTGFILLSVKHEKVREAPPPNRKISNGHKGSGVPTHKISRKRPRKMTPSSLNSGALFVDGVGFLSAEDASRFTSNMTEQSSSLSRFRVTRIADASSWWIPNNSSMNISVHDLKTSSLPDFVTRQYQKMQSDVSYTSQDRTRWIRDIRKYMEPNFLTKISEGSIC
ncbi:unnamed protein product [Hymenolepis diminuta]|uniref:Uncharacterized protein n=1 Tax=Hymenolepis diminuta TaxID=6216 RepID=A0A0R3SX57_HYMDI|nr:unnamed protein product [Hymenolepis diminuta]VUZ46872.1 unnamed protein product [Hymenolepis diminuta]